MVLAALGRCNSNAAAATRLTSVYSMLVDAITGTIARRTMVKGFVDAFKII